jgi:signal transduction histidine kinase
MASEQNTSSFPQLVALACHDLRTPLATVHGFARTLVRTSGLDERSARWLEMIDAASTQMAELLDELSLAARMELGRYEPGDRRVETLELARAVVERLGEERVAASGDGGSVRAEPAATSRAVSSLARCALRHGGLELVEVTAEDDGVSIRPITAASAPVVLGQDMRDLGAAVAVRLVDALGGGVELDGDTLRVRLPR